MSVVSSRRLTPLVARRVVFLRLRSASSFATGFCNSFSCTRRRPRHAHACAPRLHATHTAHTARRVARPSCERRAASRDARFRAGAPRSRAHRRATARAPCFCFDGIAGARVWVWVCVRACAERDGHGALDTRPRRDREELREDVVLPRRFLHHGLRLRLRHSQLDADLQQLGD